MQNTRMYSYDLTDPRTPSSNVSKAGAWISRSHDAVRTMEKLKKTLVL
jgi:hypothetical protein